MHPPRRSVHLPPRPSPVATVAPVPVRCTSHKVLAADSGPPQLCVTPACRRTGCISLSPVRALSLCLFQCRSLFNDCVQLARWLARTLSSLSLPRSLTHTRYSLLVNHMFTNNNKGQMLHMHECSRCKRTICTTNHFT